MGWVCMANAPLRRARGGGKLTMLGGVRRGAVDPTEDAADAAQDDAAA